MRICRLSDGTRDFVARLDEQDLVYELPEPGGPRELTGPRHLSDFRLLAPLGPGTRVFGIGRNYSEHVKELNPGWTQDSPLVFMKPDSALIAHGDVIPLPTGIGRVDYEGELAVVIGQAGRNMDRDTATASIMGLTIANDLSARDLQKSDGQWVRAKGYDGFCPLGPWIVCGLDPTDLSIRSTLNGKVVQEDRTASMSRDVPELVAFISSFCTLRPSDLILTGTPAGVGALAHGDTITIEIEGIGKLQNTVEEVPK